MDVRYRVCYVCLVTHDHLSLRWSSSGLAIHNVLSLNLSFGRQFLFCALAPFPAQMKWEQSSTSVLHVWLGLKIRTGVLRRLAMTGDCKDTRSCLRHLQERQDRVLISCGKRLYCNWLWNETELEQTSSASFNINYRRLSESHGIPPYLSTTTSRMWSGHHITSHHVTSLHFT